MEEEEEDEGRYVKSSTREKMFVGGRIGARREEDEEDGAIDGPVVPALPKEGKAEENDADGGEGAWKTVRT